MGVKSFMKKHNISIIVVSVITTIILAFVGFYVYSYVYSLNHDIKADRAVAIAKKEFKLDKVLWVAYHGERLSAESWDELYDKISGRYEYGIVGEKDGEEVYIIVPSHPKKYKPFITTWAPDYSFTEIVDKFNEMGAQYVADVPKDYYAAGIGSYIDFDLDELQPITELVFSYRRYDGNVYYDYYVWIEDGELKSDVHTSQIYF